MKGISMQTYMVTHEYPINITTKGSQTKHEESWQQVHPTNYSASHQAGIMKQVRKQDPTSNIKQGSMQHNASHSKNKYMNILHIPQILGPYKEKDVKLLKLVVPSISQRQISWKDCSHVECWNLHSTSKSGWKIKWSNGKSKSTIRFVASNSVKSTVKFLNSEKVKI